MICIFVLLLKSRHCMPCDVFSKSAVAVWTKIPSPRGYFHHIVTQVMKKNGSQQEMRQTRGVREQGVHINAQSTAGAKVTASSWRTSIASTTMMTMSLQPPPTHVSSLHQNLRTWHFISSWSAIKFDARRAWSSLYYESIFLGDHYNAESIVRGITILKTWSSPQIPSPLAVGDGNCYFLLFD